MGNFDLFVVNPSIFLTWRQEKETNDRDICLPTFTLEIIVFQILTSENTINFKDFIKPVGKSNTSGRVSVTRAGKLYGFSGRWSRKNQAFELKQVDSKSDSSLSQDFAADYSVCMLIFSCKMVICYIW